MMKPPYKYNVLRSYLILIGLSALSSTPIWIIRGVPFLILGIIIRWWAKAYLRQNKKLTASGPYSFVRHPFYFGNLFVDLGIVLMSGFVPLMILFPFLWFSVYLLQMRKEEKILVGIFGDAYREYQIHVSMIIPYRIPSSIRGGISFSWKNNIPREEIHRTFRLMTYPFMFFLSYLLRINGIEAFFLNKGILICSIIISLWLISHETRASLSHGKTEEIAYSIYKKRGNLMVPLLIFAFLCRWDECESVNVFWIGGAIFIFGVLLRTWAGMHVGYRLRGSKRLSTTGPYAFVRNPIYIANTMILLGLTIQMELLWLIPVVCLWCYMVYSMVVHHEEERLLMRYGEAYREYMRMVPRWIPKISNYRACKERIFADWKLLVTALRSELHNIFLPILPFLKEFLPVLLHHV